MSNSSELFQRVRHLVKTEHFDVAHVQYTQLAHYIRSLGDVPAVLEEGDIAFIRRRRFADSLPNSLKKLLLRHDTAKLQEYEIAYCRLYDGVLVRSEADKEILSNWVPSDRIAVFPPWLDLSLAERVSPIPTAQDVMFYGAMWRPVNEQAAVLFAQKVWPAILTKAPDSRFLIVGSRPSSAVQKLQGSHVIVTGFVPDVAPFYSQSAVVVAPLIAGSGIKGKVLQALAYGRPVVTTSVGAEGIAATENDGLFIRDEPEQMTECVSALLLGRSYLQYRIPARDFIARNYDWHSGVERVQEMYRSAINRKRPSTRFSTEQLQLR